MEFGKFFSDICRGQLSAEKQLFRTGYAGGLRISIPPYPVEPKKGVDPEKYSPSIGIPIVKI